MSDNDEYTEKTFCVLVEDNLIMSNYSPKNNNIWFARGSFSFHYVNDCIIIKLTPLFLWKLIHNMKTEPRHEYELDFIRMRTFASFYMRQDVKHVRIIAYKDKICFLFDDDMRTIKTDKYYSKLLHTYNRLYTDIKRHYNVFEVTDNIISECCDIVQLISNPTYDKRN